MDKNYKNHLMSVFIGLLLSLGFFWIEREIPDSPVIRNHSGLTTIQLGLTLAESPEEIYDIIGGPENEEFLINIEKFKSILLYQMIIVVLYVIYYFQMIGISQRNSSSQTTAILLFGMIILGGLMEVGEIFQLQNIFEANSSMKMEEPIRTMKYFSFAKWFLLFSTSAVLSIKVWLNEKGLILKLYSIFMLSGFFFYLTSFYKTNSLEYGLLFIFIGCILFWVYSFLRIVLSKKI